MTRPTTKDLLKYACNQFKGQFLGFIVGTSAASFVSTFFETRKVSNLWGLTARKTVVSGDTFRFLEWLCALVVGFIAFEVVNNLMKEKLSTQLEKITSFIGDRGLMSALEASAPRTSKTIKLIARFTTSSDASGTNNNESLDAAPKRKPGLEEANYGGGVKELQSSAIGEPGRRDSQSPFQSNSKSNGR
jgi:hypothetical protein